MYKNDRFMAGNSIGMSNKIDLYVNAKTAFWLQYEKAVRSNEGSMLW